MKFTIYPLRGVQNIEFGMSSEQVASIMKAAPEKFFRGGRGEGGGKFPSDHYHEQGVFFYYDDDGHLEGIEFATPAEPEFGGVNFLQIPASHAVAIVAGIDPDASVDNEGVISRKLSLAIWSPNVGDSPDAPAESMAIGRAGSYDSV
ncbi:hypothetical protein WG901_14615 [Novosphingobium sp. PS1R-30]|uniref:Uncharacterized protein n=1 Tax=Novosphingobium anseongense TaxID=3133436 RepID=A0ABU8RXR2_9SPHN